MANISLYPFRLFLFLLYFLAYQYTARNLKRWPFQSRHTHPHLSSHAPLEVPTTPPLLPSPQAAMVVRSVWSSSHSIDFISVISTRRPKFCASDPRAKHRPSFRECTTRTSMPATVSDLLPRHQRDTSFVPRQPWLTVDPWPWLLTVDHSSITIDFDFQRFYSVIRCELWWNFCFSCLPHFCACSIGYYRLSTLVTLSNRCKKCLF